MNWQSNWLRMRSVTRPGVGAWRVGRAHCPIKTPLLHDTSWGKLTEWHSDHESRFQCQSKFNSSPLKERKEKKKKDNGNYLFIKHKFSCCLYPDGKGKFLLQQQQDPFPLHVRDTPPHLLRPAFFSTHERKLCAGPSAPYNPHPSLHGSSRPAHSPTQHTRPLVTYREPYFIFFYLFFFHSAQKNFYLFKKKKMKIQ